MNRKEKIKLLKQVATGNNEALYQINKGLMVIFLTMIDDEGYWVSYFNLDDRSKDVDIDNLTTDQILNDPSIHKYTTTELKKIQKKRFVFAMPPELLNRSQPEIMEIYKKLFTKKP
jgi:hypothetical protein